MTDVTNWLETHQVLVTLVVVPLLSLIVGGLSAWYSARRVLSSERKSRFHAAELEIVKFRQSWIDALRDDLSELNSIGLYDKTDEQWHRMAMLVARVNLRMNPSDEDYLSLKNAVSNVIE